MTSPDPQFAVTHYTLVNALGRGVSESLSALQQGRSGLIENDFEGAELNTWIGRVKGLEDEPVTGAAAGLVTESMAESMAGYDCRNNRLARLALEQDDFIPAIEQAKQRYGSHRIGVFMGTSTSGIQETEMAYQQRDPKTDMLPDTYHYSLSQMIFSVADFTQHYLELKGPSLVISTACSSSAKVFATAARYLKAGLCDAAIVGGVDSLCLTTLLGFNSLELVASEKCRPWDESRSGINIGESAGFALLERQTERQAEKSGAITLLGYGESSDAYHMSTPHPQGLGAKMAMERALGMAGLSADQVDYINLHGTATRTNDSSEDCAVSSLFGDATHCSSTKGWTGHTLGAAGITEAIFGFLALTHNFLPQSLNTENIDASLSANIVMQPQQADVNVVMSNSFGFGGSNCSLIFGASVGARG